MKSKIGGKIFITAFTAILMMAALLMGKILVQANPSANGLTIFCEEETAEKLILEQNQKKILTVVGCSEDAEYQWQIRKKNTEDTWVDIFGKDDRTCEISYALLASMLDTNGRAELRCTATENDKVYESVPVDVKISWNVDSSVSAAAADAAAEDSAETGSAGVSAYGLLRSSARAAEYVSIQINYEYEDGTKAFEPYVANLQSGTAFSAAVPSPTIVGYEPWLEDGVTSAEIVPLNYAEGALDKDVSITVVYKAALVTYRARFYLQNVSDDLYTENVSLMQTEEGYTGAYPDDDVVKMPIDGFSTLYYEPERIAADGSTEFYCYYDRNYYLIHFDLAGGYGVEPVYARYGTPFVVNNPVRPGYVFEGWDLVEVDKDGVVTDKEDGTTDTLPVTIPSENQTYKASWKTVETTYTVVYWKENADDNGYSYWGSEEQSAMSATYVDGKDSISLDLTTVSVEGGTLDERRYFTYNEEKTDKQVLVEGDGSTVVNVYYDRNEYTLKFYYAAEEESGTGSTYKVVGGSSYYFGEGLGPSDTATNSDEIKLLDNFYANQSGQWGQVQSAPQLNDEGKSRSYISGEDVSLTNSNRSYHYISFTAKYGADISSLWPCNVFESAERTTGNTHGQWSGTTAYVSAWNGEYRVQYSQSESNETVKGNYQKLDYRLLFDQKFDDSSTVAYLCFWENGANISWSVPELYVYELYVPLLDGEDTTGLTLFTNPQNGKIYKLQYGPYNTCDNSTVGEQTQAALEGFAKRNGLIVSEQQTAPNGYKEKWIVRFFYDRESYKLSFFNYNDTVKEEMASYNVSLSDEFFVPDYPGNLEENAYYFAGWYTSPGCYEGSEFGNFQYDADGKYIGSDFTGYTMPADNLTLYAKWEPQIHKVRFFNQYSDIEAGNVLESGSFDVKHGEVLTGSVPTPSLSSYTFVGWFYMLNGEKQAFKPYDMAVIRDLDLFAEWSSGQLAEYKIRYVEKGTDVDIAAPLIGYALAGQTKTFAAKARNDLYTKYQERWFPITNSHSIVMEPDEEDGTDTIENEYVFEYTYLEKVPYTVRYLNAQTGEVLHQEVYYANNTASVVTEKFEPVVGYIPDAYYKRLVLSATEFENVITFYYTPDVTHAYYVVHHWIQNTEGGGYTEYAVIEGIGDINTTITADPLSVTGFEYQAGKSTASGKITEDGLKLELYYDRLKYGYKIKHVVYGDGTVLDEEDYTAENDRIPYGTVIEASAKNFDGYTLVSATPQKLEIRDEESQNVVTFYYLPKQYTVRYVPVCTEDISDAADSCSVTISQELVYSADALLGSSPTMKEGFAFVGWYTDPECTTEVNAAWVDASSHLKPAELTGEDVTVYYALFQPLRSSLTIEKKGVQSGDQNQSFLFLVEGTSGLGKNVELVVSVKGNDSITINELYVGEYKVTELADWSWRYGTTDAEKTADVQVETPKDVSTKVTFTNTRNDKMWLGGETSENNVFDAVD